MKEYKARGEAATIEENGRAMAKVLEMMTGAWQRAGDDASDIFPIQQLEEVGEESLVYFLILNPTCAVGDNSVEQVVQTEWGLHYEVYAGFLIKLR